MLSVLGSRLWKDGRGRSWAFVVWLGGVKGAWVGTGGMSWLFLLVVGFVPELKKDLTRVLRFGECCASCELVSEP